MIDIQKYKIFLKNQYLIPSRQILHENIDDNFKALESHGLKNLADLKVAVSTGVKIDKLSEETKIPRDYLNILRRELGTFDKTGIGIERINGIGPQAAVAFREAGYKTIEDIASSTKEELLGKIIKVNSEKKYYKAKLGVKDMQFVIDSANLLRQLEK